MIKQYYGNDSRVHTYQAKVTGTAYISVDATSSSEAYDLVLDSIDRLDIEDLDLEIDKLEMEG